MTEAAQECKFIDSNFSTEEVDSNDDEQYIDIGFPCILEKCPHILKHIAQLASHVMSQHPRCNIKQMEFKSKGELILWMEMEEFVHHLNFGPQNETDNDNKQYLYLLCESTKQLRRLCPAQLIVQMFDKTYQITYIGVHDHERKPGKKVLDIVETFLVNEREKETETKQLTLDDAKSVQMLVNEFLRCNRSAFEYNPVAMYKARDANISIGPQNEVLNADASLLLLGIHTQIQTAFLAQNHIIGLAIDVATNSNQYEFPLINILALTDTGIGKTVAHFVTSSASDAVYQHIFAFIREKVPHLQVVLSNYNKALVQAVSSNFSGIRHLLCLFEIQHDWWVKLQILIKDIATMKHIFVFLTAYVATQMNLGAFQSLAALFLENYKETCPAFLSFVKDHYLDMCHLWAAPYRAIDNCYIDSNKYVKCFYNRLARTYAEVPLTRLDTLFTVLIELSGAYMLDITNKNHYRYEYNHDLGMNIPLTAFRMLNDRIYEIYDDMLYRVFKNFDICPHGDNCIQKCIIGNCVDLCPHMYICSCSDYSFLCRHVHRIHSSLINNATPETERWDPEAPSNSANVSDQQAIATLEISLRSWMQQIMDENIYKLRDMTPSDAANEETDMNFED